MRQVWLQKWTIAKQCVGVPFGMHFVQGCHALPMLAAVQ
jgi:hypothetical protein